MIKYPIIARHFTSCATRENLESEIKKIILLELDHGIHHTEREIDVLKPNLYNSNKSDYDDNDIMVTIKF